MAVDAMRWAAKMATMPALVGRQLSFRRKAARPPPLHRSDLLVSEGLSRLRRILFILGFCMLFYTVYLVHIVYIARTSYTSVYIARVALVY